MPFTRRSSTRPSAGHIGRGFVAYLGARRIAVSRDMRLSSPSLAEAFIEGALAQGADVVDCGMMATDMLYYVVATDKLEGGAQITASHNPPQYNGIKMVRAEALPLSGDAGLGEIRDMIQKGTLPAPAARPGTRSSRNVLDAYIGHVFSFIDKSAIKPFTCVLDAGSGMGGLVAPKIFEQLPCKIIPMCMEVDGRFPNHEANPLIEQNRAHIVERVVKEKADVGIAWDGDADRCFFIDGNGDFVSGDFITALLAEAFLMKYPGSTIVYDLRASHAVKDTVERLGGTAIMNRVGHSFIKKTMREKDGDLRRRSDRPLLLPGQLLRRQRLHSGRHAAGAHVEEGTVAGRAAGAAQRQVFHLRRDQHQGREHGRREGEARRHRLALRGRHAVTHWTACRSTTATGTSTCARRTPSRCCV